MIRILTIDDSRLVHAFICDALSGAPIEWVHAMNGYEGIDHAGRASFDLILLDWEMPDLNGPQVLRELKSRGITAPVVMLTSRNQPGDILQMLDQGVSEYVMKPFTGQLLIEKFESVLGCKVAN